MTDDAGPVVACRGLSVGFGQTPVLVDIDLAVERGTIVALLGGSGCGKSTLLRALTGLQPPLAGEVRLLGDDLYALDADGRRGLLRRTGMAFQQDALFGSMSVLDNVAMPVRELTRLPEIVIREMARIKLALVGLAGFEHRSPNSLSGGQRKRAALARASILDPEVVFCDEPSAGLDPVVAAGIDDTLKRFRDALGVTIVIVTHELESIRAIADRAIMLGGGRVIAAGTVAELEQSDDQDVYNFFHRIAASPAGPASSPLDRMTHARTP
ncbi:MAG TPA: ATP-binding cassette domain-containing protein [Kofleriaceae bacterium]|nr:ATP-binding cassette domain-containing protein [Kofleriaceae bacterium]